MRDLCRCESLFSRALAAMRSRIGRGERPFLRGLRSCHLAETPGLGGKGQVADRLDERPLAANALVHQRRVEARARSTVADHNRSAVSHAKRKPATSVGRINARSG